MEGLLLLDKSTGTTCARVVDKVKLLLPRGTKIGHAGTLDPLASGLLVLLVGRTTRQCERVMAWAKTYVTSIRLDMSSPTLDLDSNQLSITPVAIQPTQQDVENSLRTFVGTIQQAPPAYSAIKVRGKRACDRLREGEKITLQPRPVQIHSIEVLGYEWPLLNVQVVCGRGTYIRSIARDLGLALNTGGVITQLRRTRVGQMNVEDAIPLDQLTRESIPQRLIPLEPIPHENQ